MAHANAPRRNRNEELIEQFDRTNTQLPYGMRLIMVEAKAYQALGGDSWVAAAVAAATQLGVGVI
ncbi:hypothetical protein BPOR_0329g00010 [Botrytis porri]|uniref:Uncharacterized protein n=1 Tax=Botrytis porri TaxID=87229 RepID=A0A4Z1KQI2_9HELO|nr:hypothetical protein BPOR_0329g00010 [Botrytis porri]